MGWPDASHGCDLATEGCLGEVGLRFITEAVSQRWGETILAEATGQGSVRGRNSWEARGSADQLPGALGRAGQNWAVGIVSPEKPGW